MVKITLCDDFYYIGRCISERMKKYQEISKTPLERFVDKTCDLTDYDAKMIFDEFYSKFIKVFGQVESKINVSKNLRDMGFTIKLENWQDINSVWRSGTRISGIKWKGGTL